MAAMASWRVAPLAPMENKTAMAAAAAMADFLMIIVLPELCGLADVFAVLALHTPFRP